MTEITTDIITDIEELATAIDRLCREHPHAASLLQAFGPLFVNQQRWLGARRRRPGTFAVDPIRFQAGISLLQQGQLLLPEDPWSEAGLATAEAIGQGFPALVSDMLRLAAHINAGRCDCCTLGLADLAGDALIVAAQRLDIAPVALRFWQRQLTRLLLTQKARDLGAELAALSWKKGTCPVCGSFPHLALIGEKNQRWLHCPTCSHQWVFSRLACPWCDHEDPQQTHTIFIEGEKQASAFTCDHCRKYLITSNQSGTLRPNHAGLIALSLVHLDLILQEKGFGPMAACEWNTLDFSPDL